MVGETGCNPGDPPAALIPTDLLAFLSVAADPTRLHLLALLARAELSSSAIAAALALRPNLVSHHLQVLSREGLLARRRQGRWVYYRVDSRALDDRVGTLFALLNTRRPARHSTELPADGIA